MAAFTETLLKNSNIHRCLAKHHIWSQTVCKIATVFNKQNMYNIKHMYHHCSYRSMYSFPLTLLAKWWRNIFFAKNTLSLSRNWYGIEKLGLGKNHPKLPLHTYILLKKQTHKSSEDAIALLCFCQLGQILDTRPSFEACEAQCELVFLALSGALVVTLY